MEFPISRDPPEGGTFKGSIREYCLHPTFPISRDPPEGGTVLEVMEDCESPECFQFLGIPPKGERCLSHTRERLVMEVSNF